MLVVSVCVVHSAAMQTCIRVALTASVALQSAASQSQHVVNMLTAEDPVSASDVSELSKKEVEITGDTQKGGTAAQAQVSIELHWLPCAKIGAAPGCA